MTVTDAVEGSGSESRSGLDKDALLKDLKRQVVALEDDLRERSESVEEFRIRLRGEYQQALDASRTAATYGAWRDERVTQAAVAWVLACVFVRFCEDNGLIEEPFLAGPGERLVEAEERHEAFFREHPNLNNRDWLVAAFRHVAAANRTAAGLFDEKHNPLWGLTPSYEAATELLGFWRRWGADGRIRYDFTDREWDTRFLGDLYQDLSEHARKTYALLQTPEFVEEFILDLTLEPAVSEEEFGLDPVWVGPDGEERRGLRTIDPACGSGHFLLGIFRRLVEKWRAATPAADDWTVVRRALESVHGCDKNPFAVSVARFRLLVAAMKEAGARTLAEAPVFPINVAVGDSLLHGRGAAGIQQELDLFAVEDEGGSGESFAYQIEDVWEYAGRVDLLGRGTYHVVVGNPPYITVKDKRENENYRAAYDACSGKYALSVPFVQRLFELAIKGVGGSFGGGGYVGQITANSFMKREFGKKLIEEFLPGVDLSHVIDSSEAYIPGHNRNGTPTVILVGRNRAASRSSRIRAVLSVSGEEEQPPDPRTAPVWKAIIEQIDAPGSSSPWITVEDADRDRFASHPWSLSGGGAGDLLAGIERAASRSVSSFTRRIGFYGVIGADDAMIAAAQHFARCRTESAYHVPLTVGDEVRDWSVAPGDHAFHPYDSNRNLLPLEAMPEHARRLWPYRSELGNRATFSKATYFAEGRPWYEWHQLPLDRGVDSRSISFSEVATHNHFVAERAAKAYKQTAPILRFSEGVKEEEYLGLLGILNSSTVCYWLKQVCPKKGGEASQPWSWTHQFNGTKVGSVPLPGELPIVFARRLDSLAQELAYLEPSYVCELSTPAQCILNQARSDYARVRRYMLFLQEELDWQVYGFYGLLSGVEVTQVVCDDRIDDVPRVCLGERAFEIVLARKLARGEVNTAWFERHSATQVTEIPERWPAWYRNVVQTRIDIIERNGNIGLIERPEYKRRWAAESWVKKEKTAIRNWLLDQCEDRGLWFSLRGGVEQPRMLTINQLADAVSRQAEVPTVAALFAADHLGKPDLPLAQILAEIVSDEHVPYLAAMRYKDSGLRNREQWEEVWQLQREEDRSGHLGGIPVPPKYKSSDFVSQSYWSNRGKLDVPKERFISYPDASPDADSTLLLGWAGWDHKDQAQALVNLIEDRAAEGGWGTERILPLVAGLREVMPWVKQWHGEYDPEWEGVPAEDFEAYLEEQMTKHQLSAADLKAWRPVKKTRGRKAAAPKKATAASEQTALDAE